MVGRMAGECDSVVLHDDSPHIIRIVFEIVQPLVDLLCVEWNSLGNDMRCIKDVSARQIDEDRQFLQEVVIRANDLGFISD